MPGEFPFFIEGKIVEIISSDTLAIVKVVNGNIYHLHPWTPGIDFSSLRKDQMVLLEVTRLLTRVLSAKVIENDT